MKLSDLPVVNYTMPGYERLWAFPRHWFMWQEGDRFYALTFEHVRGSTRAYEGDTRLCKEEIPRDVFEKHYPPEKVT